MKNIIFFSLFLLISSSCFTQIIYEPGFFTDNIGRRTECLIKNIDWKNNPIEFEYKLDEDGISRIGTVNNISEFSIQNGKKYIRAKVEIDRSKSLIKYLSNSRNPEFKEETLFLQTLADGDASLYLYENNNLLRFFFKTEESSIEQLIYKKYLTVNGKIGENSDYRKQLWSKLKCKELNLNEVKYVRYKQTELVNYFNKYNSCVFPDHVNTYSTNSNNKDWIKLGIRVGLNSSSLNFKTPQPNSNFSFENNTNIRLGIELEAFLPFNKTKWSIFLQPMYQSFKDEQQLKFQRVSVDYKSIEISLGLRHYFFLDKNSKIFLNSAFLIDRALNSKIDFESSSDFKIESQSAFNMGLGYVFKNTYSIKLNYTPRRELLGNFALNTSGYEVLTIVFGFDLL